MSDSQTCGRIIRALSRLLEREIAALQAGRFALVHELAADKERLGAELEAAAAALTPTEQRALASDFATLGALITRDAELLERAARATGDVARELRRVRDRHSLRGLYGKSGETRGAPETPANRIDASL
ncbi:flagellar P-ring protein precursor [Oceanicola granulosus HTCC2516]|uniref:Flagellar P-ring protein n=1 Tax=Oceanicola granulosus (strain ATCC BAA-861 / DSM 15982 / KCTC 12143 / HTCC2516) TaxID=314256 RepID=Q2CGH1_OCEGH|nr:hypothetical protein [Oceanicola granulosus]EAR51747.1 flagellar P-ring protein precursor [Oceanicola granulosus HTCC2516]